MPHTPIVTFSGVTKTYGVFTALHTIDLDIAEGEFVTLLGPSGCGKTTTLRLIGGFEEASSGKVLIDNQNVTFQPPYRRPVNTVFQDYALFPHMSIADNIGYGLSVRASRISKAERQSRVQDALTMVGLEGFGARRPGQLSGGQKQRVAMARAIVKRPRVLLLDEPLSALDVKLREGMQVELKRLHRELGITFVMVTHDQNEALALSDRIVVMDRGKIAQIGTPTELYDRPASPYVADFIGATNIIPSAEIDSDQQGTVYRIGSKGALKGPTTAAGRGTQITIGIRPERICLQATAQANALQCRVMETLFHGNRLRVELQVEGLSVPLFADFARQGPAMSFAPSQEVNVYIDPADVMVFEGDRQ